MSDVNCPYCGASQEIDHDDGYGYEEDEQFEQECDSCEKEFKFKTSIIYHYNVECQDDEHDIEVTTGHYNYKPYTRKECKNCDWYDIEFDAKDLGLTDA